MKSRLKINTNKSSTNAICRWNRKLNQILMPDIFVRIMGERQAYPEAVFRWYVEAESGVSFGMAFSLFAVLAGLDIQDQITTTLFCAQTENMWPKLLPKHHYMHPFKYNEMKKWDKVVARPDRVSFLLSSHPTEIPAAALPLNFAGVTSVFAMYKNRSTDSNPSYNLGLTHFHTFIMLLRGGSRLAEGANSLP